MDKLHNEGYNPYRFRVDLSPKPEEVRAARKDAGLSQTSAAKLVHTTCRTWQQWEAAENKPGHRRMHPAFWELFHRKVTKFVGPT